MNKESYQKGIEQLLPEHETDINFDYNASQQQATQNEVEETEQRINAAQLARIKYKEKRALEKMEKQKEDPTYGLSPRELAKHEAEQARIREDIAEIEVIEDSPMAQEFLSGGISDISPYSGTTPRDVTKLLSSLNINLNMYLTRSDTYNLLSCLLTCNEAQLDALMHNNKVPLAIKTVIKRLQMDAKDGNMCTVERLWDRVFGKADKIALNTLPDLASTTQGLIPNTVVSREAYVILRDTIIGK